MSNVGSGTAKEKDVRIPLEVHRFLVLYQEQKNQLAPQVHFWVRQIDQATLLIPFQMQR